jgi:YD repeat-containing protein
MSRPLALAAVTLAVVAAAPAATAATYGYDDQHRLRSVSTASGTVTLAYDRSGRLVAIRGADGGVTSVAYDVAGKPTFWLPEIGDEVLVAFVPGDTRDPYAVGLLWQEKRPDGGRIAFSVTTAGRLLTCSACP